MHPLSNNNISKSKLWEITIYYTFNSYSEFKLRNMKLEA